jgi:hypothetical protein
MYSSNYFEGVTLRITMFYAYVSLNSCLEDLDLLLTIRVIIVKALDQQVRHSHTPGGRQCSAGLTASILSPFFSGDPEAKEALLWMAAVQTK